MNRFAFLLVASLLLFAIDYYAFQSIRTVFQQVYWNKFIYTFYWVVNVLTLAGIFTLVLLSPDFFGKQFRNFMGVWVFMTYFSKLILVLFLAIDDVVRAGQWVYDQLKPTLPQPESPNSGSGISRSEFLATTGVVAATIPLVSMSYGIISGAHDYKIRRITLSLPNLPKAFDGLRIAQLSDIHSGSFFNKTAVKGGVEMLLAEKPDVVFFTGDLVNNTADEVNDYIDVFNKVMAPLGVYSTLGNHDYGDYVAWSSPEAKRKNLETLKAAHKELGWKLLVNENILLEETGEKLAIIGVENWGTGRFPKYGKLTEAYTGSQEAATKILLSHDPSHWDAEVRQKFPDIDLMLAGHTHGMQFGLEIGDFKWSPVQYVYKQWAGLYQADGQYLYVNRGFGYIGFPGRIGMPPEITIIDLKSA